MASMAHALGMLNTPGGDPQRLHALLAAQLAAAAAAPPAPGLAGHRSAPTPGRPGARLLSCRVLMLGVSAQGARVGWGVSTSLPAVLLSAWSCEKCIDDGG